MTNAEYIMQRLYEEGVETIFMVSGGGIIYLTDALKNNGRLKYICCHHEQAAAMAAVGYTKASRKLGAVLVTTGCGGSNTITALLHAWQDNIPCIFLSGQVARKDMLENVNVYARQIGMQEADMVKMVKDITKHAVTLNSKYDIGSEMTKALELARTGRMGPVWIDVPVDVQRMEYVSKIVDFNTVKEMLAQAKRPLIVAGHGVWLDKAEKFVQLFAYRNNIPIVFSRLGLNTIEDASPLHIGEIGIKGTRAGNLAVQNADLLLVLGCRLSRSSIGYDPALFAREAKKVIVDIDILEHAHWDDYMIVPSTITAWTKQMGARKITSVSVNKWQAQCALWKQLYPVMLPSYAVWKDGVHMYHFMDELSKIAPENTVFVTDTGSALFTSAQGLKLKAEQIYVISGAQVEMGFAVPAAIGVSTIPDKVVVAITGDGSLQMNIQELQTIKHHQFPIKLFVLNNSGYLSIKATQEKNLNENYIGIDSDSGISFPDSHKIAEAYGIPYMRLDTPATLESDLAKVFDNTLPMVCEVICGGKQEVSPVVSAMNGKLRPMEDMYPFLPEEEYLKNLYVKQIER